MEAASHSGTFRSSLISQIKALVTGFHLPYQQKLLNIIQSKVIKACYDGKVTQTTGTAFAGRAVQVSGRGPLHAVHLHG
eukprot:7345171-Prymnesium_polylepis.1